MPRGGGVSLYVRNVPDQARQDDLRYIFEKYGPVRDVYIPVDYYSRRPRGFAYVEYEEVRDADDALRETRGLVRFDGREMEVEPAQGDRKSREFYFSKSSRSRGYDDRPSRGGGRRRSRSRSRSRSVERRRSSRRRSRSRSEGRRSSKRSRRSDEGKPSSRRRSRSRSGSDVDVKEEYAGSGSDRQNGDYDEDVAE